MDKFMMLVVIIILWIYISKYTVFLQVSIAVIDAMIKSMGKKGLMSLTLSLHSLLF